MVLALAMLGLSPTGLHQLLWSYRVRATSYIQLPPLMAGSPALQFSYGVVVDDPLPGGVTEILVATQITGPGGDSDPSNNEVSETTPMAPEGEIFADGFESGDVSAWDLVVP